MSDKTNWREIFKEEIAKYGEQGLALRGLRYRENLSQAKLAKKLNMSQQRISEMENGKLAIKPEVAKKIGRIFHINYRVFLREPTIPGMILEENYIKPLNLNLNRLAKSLDISRATLDKIRKGKTRITADIASKLSQTFGTSMELWLNLQKKYDLWLNQ